MDRFIVDRFTIGKFSVGKLLWCVNRDGARKGAGRVEPCSTMKAEAGVSRWGGGNLCDSDRGHLFVHRIVRYTALKFDSPQGKKKGIALKMTEEVHTQVPSDDFQALEDKVYRTIELYKAAREARLAAERDVQRLREQLEEREEQVETLQREMVQLRREREEIRGRVEKMLHQIESISQEQAAS